MIGSCPWRGSCGFETHADSWHKKKYCNDAIGCKRCPQRPMNSGNKEVQTSYTNRKRSDSNAHLGRVLFILLIGVPLLLKLLSMLGIF